MTRRSIILVVCGAVAVLVGVAVAFIGRSDEEGPASSQRVAVLVATSDIAAGTSGESVTGDHLVKVEQIDATDRAAGALSDQSQLDGRTFTVAVGSGDQVVATDLNSPALREGAVEVPEGTEAVAIEVPFIEGVAGYAAPGDEVNVFALLDPADGTQVVSDTTTVGILSNVVVLDVSAEIAPRVATQSGGVAATSTSTSVVEAANPKQLTYLLAVPSADVAKLIQAAAFHRLYLTIPAKGSPPMPATIVDDGNLTGGGE